MARPWKDIDISDLYAYLAILFYMALHIENDTKAILVTAREGRPNSHSSS